jgi:hypothetical protein
MASSHIGLKRFQAKWIPVRVKKTRQINKWSLGSDSVGTEKAPGCVSQPCLQHDQNAV